MGSNLMGEERYGVKASTVAFHPLEIPPVHAITCIGVISWKLYRVV